MNNNRRNTMKVEHIAIGYIAENSNNPRSAIGSVEDLKASIQAHGLLQPIAVRKVADEGFEVIAGSRRLRACRELGMKTVPCQVIDADDDKAYELATAENLVRENMTAVDEANAVAKLFAQGKSRAEIGAMFGKSARWAEGRRRIVSLGDKAMKMLAAGKMNFGHAEALTLCRHEDVEKWLGQVQWRSPEELRNAIMNEKPLLERAPFNARKACAKCEKRSGCQRDLFDDVQNDYCLDRECFDAKVKKEAERIRKGYISQGYQEVPEDDIDDAMHGWGWIDADTDDDDDKSTVRKLESEGVKPMFWVDDKTADHGLAYRYSHDDDDDSDEDEEPVDVNSVEYRMRKLDYDQRNKVREEANAEEKHVMVDKMQAVFGTMRSDTKAFILDMIGRSFEDEEGNEKSYLDDPYRAAADFLEEVADHNIGWNGADEGIRKFLEMDSRETFERAALDGIEDGSDD